jgi:hypothetical protein
MEGLELHECPMSTDDVSVSLNHLSKLLDHDVGSRLRTRNGKASSMRPLSLSLDSDEDPDDSDPKLYGELKLKGLATRMGCAISTYRNVMQAFDPANGNIDRGVKLILAYGSAVITLTLKAFGQGRLMDDYCTQVIEDARQSIELAQQILVHCNRAVSEYVYRDREIRGDGRLKHLARDISDAIIVYNKLLEANPPGAELHIRICCIDGNVKEIVGIAIEKYDEALHARKPCGKESKEARKIVGHAGDILSFWSGDGS